MNIATTTSRRSLKERVHYFFGFFTALFWSGFTDTEVLPMRNNHHFAWTVIWGALCILALLFIAIETVGIGCIFILLMIEGVQLIVS